jgi:hypothetical protein
MNLLQKILIRRTFIPVFLGMFLFPLIMQAQLQSITAFSEYSTTLSKRLDVKNADAVGGGVDVVYSVAENVTIGLRAGYYLYSVSQTDQLNRWGWRFWNDRYLNKIQADMRADPSLSAMIGSVQKMDLIPVMLHCDYTFTVADNLTMVPTLGAGMAFYQRRLFADETWTKVFPAAEYSFTYSFRNFAPAKKGNPIFGTAGVTVRYKLFSSVGITSSLHYTQYLETKDRFGYNEFIFTNESGFRLGLEFFY